MYVCMYTYMYVHTYMYDKEITFQDVPSALKASESDFRYKYMYMYVCMYVCIYICIHIFMVSK